MTERNTKLLILFTKQAADAIGNLRLDVESIAVDDHRPVDIGFLNGNQNREGIQKYKETYDDIVVVMKDTKQGEIAVVADDLDIDKRDASATSKMVAAWSCGLN